MDVAIVDLSVRPDLREVADALVAANLPAFMMWESPGNWRWHRIYDLHPSYQLCALDSSGEVVAAAHGVPVAWDGTAGGLPEGYDDVLVRLGDADARPAATCLLSISVAGHARRGGLATALVLEARRRAEEAGFLAVITPLRPTHKGRHPEVPFDAYVSWSTDDHEPFDPWLRTHVRVGGEILALAPRSLVIAQPVARWEQYAGRALRSPGSYVVEGALVPIEVDGDVGTYAEPNVWVCHWTDSARAGA